MKLKVAVLNVSEERATAEEERSDSEVTGVVNACFYIINSHKHIGLSARHSFVPHSFLPDQLTYHRLVSALLRLVYDKSTVSESYPYFPLSLMQFLNILYKKKLKNPNKNKRLVNLLMQNFTSKKNLSQLQSDSMYFILFKPRYCLSF